MAETPECIEGRLVDLTGVDLSDPVSIDRTLLTESLQHALECVGEPGEAIAGYQTSPEYQTSESCG